MDDFQENAGNLLVSLIIIIVFNLFFDIWPTMTTVIQEKWRRSEFKLRSSHVKPLLLGPARQLPYWLTGYFKV